MGVAQVTLEDGNAQFHVLLDRHSDDHVVTCMRVDSKGFEVEFMLGHDTWDWDRAVGRARRALAFV